MRRIVILGDSGAGKSTRADRRSARRASSFRR